MTSQLVILYESEVKKYMGFTEILQAISTVGFPIVMCLVMFYYMQKNDERHKEEVVELTEAINNNTLVMSKVLEKLEYEE